MLVYIKRSTLVEVAVVVEQIYTIAATANLTPTVEDYQAARCDYQAVHRLSKTRMCEEMRSSLTAMTEDGRWRAG